MSEVQKYITSVLDPIGLSHSLSASVSARMAVVVMASDYDALAAECERLRELFKESERHLHHWQRQASANGRSTKAMETERDAALEELAALKGGREAVACACGSVDHSVGYESPQAYWVECGDCGYATERAGDRSQAIAAWNSRNAAPPAKASAWVPVSERLPEDGEEGLCALHVFDSASEPLIVVPFRMIEGEWHAHFRDDDDENSIECAMDGTLHQPTHWMPLPAAPTPGASDGKEEA